MGRVRGPGRMLLGVVGLVAFLALLGPGGERPVEAARPRPPVYISFVWHMHQPIYYPYESVTQTQQRGVYSFDLADVHRQRSGPYSSWPVDAVQAAMYSGLDHAGAQVSFTGTLIENLDDLERNGWGFGGWKGRWRESNGWTTAMGNPRLDLVGFGYHHPLMPLVDTEVSRRQIDAHRRTYASAWNDPSVPHRPYSKGFFPAESAFAPWIIPALETEGFQWTLVDNIHFQRACEGYPWSSGGNLIPPNRAEQMNADPGDWTQLTNIWAPTKVSAGWSFRPHWVRNVDPESGQESRIIAVPTARYMGNEDGRGGFGALQYEHVMSQIEWANDDPDHPILIVLHHDGDNYGGGAESYYHGNFQAFLDWARSQGHRFVPTTIQDYLAMYPPDPRDVAHVESGSWSGADNGDPEFKKWLGDPNPADGYSPDINSWAAVVAVANRVKTAGALDPTGPEQAEAWRLLLNAYVSCYWYWDGTEIWDSNPTRAVNGATWHADRVLARGGADPVGPEIFLPQREPYNPGGFEWGRKPMPETFEVWTLAYDVSGLDAVTLHYRVDADGRNPLSDDENETLAGGPGVSPWVSIPMHASAMPGPRTNPAPAHRAERYVAEVAGEGGHLLDYYVEAVDLAGNRTRSPMLHVYVGTQGAGTAWSPRNPAWDARVVVRSPAPGTLLWGVDGWTAPPAAAVPAGSMQGTRGCETPLAPDGRGGFVATIGPFADARDIRRVDFVIHRADGSWDNNGGADYRIALAGKSVWWDRERLDPALPVTVWATGPGDLHAGTDGWQGVFEVPFVGPNAAGSWEAVVPAVGGVQVLDFVVRYADGTWANNGGQDYHLSR